MGACGFVRADRPIARWVRGARAGGALLVAMAVGSAGRLEAQTTQLTQRLALAPKAGLAVPAGQFSDYVGTGPSVNFRLSYQIRSGTALTADLGHDWLRGEQVSGGWKETPAMRLRRYVVGVESRVGDWDVTYPWSLGVELGAGATSFLSDPFRSGQSLDLTRFDQTYFTAAGGVQLGYFIRPSLEVVADGKLYWSAINKDDTQPLASIFAPRLKPMGSALMLPLTIALKAWL